MSERIRNYFLVQNYSQESLIINPSNPTFTFKDLIMTLHYIENAFFIEALTGFQEKEKKGFTETTLNNCAQQQIEDIFFPLELCILAFKILLLLQRRNSLKKILPS